VSDVLVRTFTQAIQACLPIAVALCFARRRQDAALHGAIRRGVYAALPLGVLAALLYKESQSQIAWQLTLSLAVLAAASWILWVRRAVWIAVAAVSALIVVRQCTEIGALFVFALDSRLSAIALRIVAGVALALVVSRVWMRIERSLPADAAATALETFAGLFLIQVVLYAFHELTEAALLPFSTPLHTATEPFGPEGMYAPYINAAIVLIPLLAAARRFDRARQKRWALSAGVAIVIACAALVLLRRQPVTAPPAVTAAAPAAPAPTVADMASLTSSPHVIFRHTRQDQFFGHLAVAPLDAPETRVAYAAISCERISFAAGAGICLAPDSGLSTAYHAAVIDASFAPHQALRLPGSPSRTRVSFDGRLGATTVFLPGAHSYGGSFSTSTMLIDMTSGRSLGDLETFAAERGGKPFHAADFNFWGVTFAHDGDTFYASLRTAGRIFLVKGSVKRRTLSVVHDSVECPAISPDDRLIAFKKRVGVAEDDWAIYVLDLSTMTEQPVQAAQRHVDDQIEWLDASHILYAVRRQGGPDVWVAPIDRPGPARIFLHDAESPIVVR
jgi:hypothetical protein